MSGFNCTLKLLIISIFITPRLATNINVQHPILLYKNGSSSFSTSASYRQYLSSKNFIISAPKWPSSLSRDTDDASLYDCSVKDDTFTCASVRTGSNFSTQKYQDYLLGSSLASDPASEETIACSHLRLNDIETKYNYPNGGCLVFKTKEKVEFDRYLLPFQDSSLQISFNTYFYSHSMVGFSSLLDKETGMLLLGAPGFWGWRGCLVYYAGIKERLHSVPVIRYPIELRNKPDSYFGYSLAIGRPFKNDGKIIAVGAPRSAGFGAVWYFSLDKLQASQRTDYIRSSRFVSGRDIAGYFGAAVAFEDLNNDKMDDLLIGEPNYSTEKSGDSGRVLIYQSDGTTLNLVRVLKGLEMPRARFGYWIANTGDLNQDGIKDIVISAPFEKTGGSVYIYHGQKNSLPEEFAQRISASEHLSRFYLKGFGIFALSNFDYDANNYPDLLISSPLSGKSVLLRTGLTISKRAYFRKNSSEVYEMIGTMTVEPGKISCVKPIHVILKDQVNDKLTPMQFNLKYELVKKSEKFCPSCPVLVKNDPLVEQIVFETGCGSRGFCLSNITMALTAFQKNSNVSDIIEGLHETVTLVLRVENTGENAHSARVILTVQPAIKLLSHSFEIFQQNETAIDVQIDVGNPFEQETAEYKVLFDLTLLDDHQNLTFTSVFYTRSELSPDSVDRRNLVIPILRYPSVNLQSQLKEHTFFEHLSVRKRDFETFAFRLMVLKSNVSTVKHSLIALDFPVYLANNEKLAYRPRIEAKNRISVSCDTGLLDLEQMPDDLDTFGPLVEALKSPKRAKRSPLEASSVAIYNSTEKDSSRREQLVIDCTNFVCRRIQCILGTLNNRQKSANLQIVTAINMKQIEKYFAHSFKSIYYKVEAKARVIYSKGDSEQNWTSYGQVGAILEQLPYKSSVPLRIIVICSLVAIFFLFLITMALIKVGFFHRKKREELREMTNRMSRLIDPNLLSTIDGKNTQEFGRMESVDLDE